VLRFDVNAVDDDGSVKTGAEDCLDLLDFVALRGATAVYFYEWFHD
jgi:hypothetical protein